MRSVPACAPTFPPSGCSLGACGADVYALSLATRVRARACAQTVRMALPRGVSLAEATLLRTDAPRDGRLDQIARASAVADELVLTGATFADVLTINSSDVEFERVRDALGMSMPIRGSAKEMPAHRKKRLGSVLRQLRREWTQSRRPRPLSDATNTVASEPEHAKQPKSTV